MVWNQLKTAVLLASLSSLFIGLGYLIGGQSGVTYAFIFSIITNGLLYFFSDKLVLRLYKAKPLEKTTHPEVYDTVGKLANTMGIPMPKLWIIESAMPNAFATGRNPAHASVAVTTGILQLLSPQELRGVLAHELSHVKNRDILIATVAATLASAIGFLADIARYSAFWGNSKNSDQRSNPIGLFFIALLMPIAAVIIQLAISRSREYLADETSAKDCGDPLALANALEKLKSGVAHNHLHANDTLHASTAPLFIVNPFFGKTLLSLFSTHPPLEKRIARLRAMTQQQ